MCKGVIFLKIGEKEIKDKYVRVRVTQKEKDIIKSMALDKGFRSEAEYLRNLINNDMKK